ncbi:uncharacterized protein LOC101736974 [Bombyx mori]|uniref:Uncharacterized protein n=1 Tax=Bombyx mori TaxID=7091 RepID=A0A8R2HNC8_BOMMO|nr:uncharacterized protein LOC101736974 [Bombyx mori]
MKPDPKACCVICQLVFCCGDCRQRHEKFVHGLTYDCPICRGSNYLCNPQTLTEDFIKHIFLEHLPLYCKKCNKQFNRMEDLINVEECTSISELIKENEIKAKEINVDVKFDSLYERVLDEAKTKANRTAVITPVVRKKHIVDYESSESDEDNLPEGIGTPHPEAAGKTPRLKRQRVATPHVKKLLSLMRQKVVEEYEETLDDGNVDGSPVTKTTPSRNENETEEQKEMTTPTSHVLNLMKLAQTVTTSTPTHPIAGSWSLFKDPGADSPLSEIENTESPAQSIGNEPSKSESESVPPKLKSIIVTGTRLKLGSQDSSEKHVTFQDSNNTDVSSKTKKVKFADDTVFQQEPKLKRVFRKPKRMLTPGPQKRFCYNPRFQALINRFENQGYTLTRTPVTNREKPQETTPPVGEPSNLPARAINFKEESPIIDGNYSRDSDESYKTCTDSPQLGMSTALTALTANIAGSLQNCLNNILRTSDDETEIQFKFTITKKKFNLRNVAEADNDDEAENLEPNKENIWSTVAKAVKNVFWGEQASTTPYKSESSMDSSSSKRKCQDMTDPDTSPLNHKKHKYEGRIRGRPPLRSKFGVSSLRSSHSAEQHSMMKEVSFNQDDAMNLSF